MSPPVFVILSVFCLDTSFFQSTILSPSQAASCPQQGSRVQCLFRFPQVVFPGSSSSNSDPPQMAKMTLPRSFNSLPPSRAWANLHSTRTRSSLSGWRANGCTAKVSVNVS
ncbi:hypothetical protein C8R45DRAFT_992049 [Mycena sanguinolenta]|nr:hypothetical protein C8R45DRAFT_992049 [Mycena sanguinolenta]